MAAESSPADGADVVVITHYALSIAHYAEGGGRSTAAVDTNYFTANHLDTIENPAQVTVPHGVFQFVVNAASNIVGSIIGGVVAYYITKKFL